MKGSRPILLVDDDQVDVMTVQRIFKDLHVTNPLDITEDGEKALAYLRDPKNQMPCIILLDIHMPRMNGIEFLRIVKQDEMLRRIPVIVLTASEEEEDKLDSFDLGVAGYMLKPPDYKQFVEVVRTIDYYWTVSELPDEV
jgi:CheY-like chemotaxis protein